MADLTSLYADRASFGLADTAVPAGPLRLGGLAAATGGASRLAIDAAGNVTAGVLAPPDIPPAFTRRDVAEEITQPWTWNVSGLGPPLLTARSLGTRIVLYPMPANTEYAFGMENSHIWTSAPAGSGIKWYQGATERLRLDTDGTLRVINGSGMLSLGAAGGGTATVAAGSSLSIRSGSAIFVDSGEGNGGIVPWLPYREDLGLINFKFRALHCAELWAETLVAQDTLATIGGRLLIGPTTTLVTDLPASAAGAGPTYQQEIQLKHRVTLGDWLVMEAGGKFELMQVVYDAGVTSAPFVYLVYRNQDGSGLSDWYMGDAAFNTGTVGNGFIDLYSVRGVVPGSTAGPTIVGNVRMGDGTNWREHWAIGNLKGLYENSTHKYGAAFGDRNGPHLQIDSVDGITVRPYGSGGVISAWGMDGTVRLGYLNNQIVFDPALAYMGMTVGGVERFSLRSDGTAHLSTGLVCGAFAGTIGIVRSNNATAFNAGQGFYFEAQQATGTARALIGNSVGRRLQWDGASLRVVTDGLTLDENGITVLQGGGTAAEPGRLIRFGTTGGFLYDSTAAPGTFYIVRETGNILIQAGAGAIDIVTLYGANRMSLAINPNLGIAFDGTLAGGSFYPGQAEAFNLGTAANRWNYLHSVFVHTTYGMFANGANYGYYVYVNADAAAKPVSSTWRIPPGLRRDMEPVDRPGALALLRRVDVIRYRTEDGTPAIGVVPEDIAPILPLSVRANGDEGRLDWDAHELFMLNVAAVQALAARLDTLEGRTN